MTCRPFFGIFYWESQLDMSLATRQSLLERVRKTTTGESWNQFVQIYDGLILNWLRHQHVRPEDAEDIRQEVMTVVYQEIGSFQHNGRTGAFRSWLRKITANRLHRLWQKRKGPGEDKQLEKLADELADDRSRLTSIWDQQHDQFLLNSLLDDLSQRFQPKSIAIFRRIALQEEKASKVAADLEMSLGAVRVAQHRVLRALKEIGHGLLE